MQFKVILFHILISILLVACNDTEFVSYTMPSPETKMCLSGYVCPDSTSIVISLNTGYYVDTINESKRQMLNGNETTVVMYENGNFFDTLQSKSRNNSFGKDSIEYYYVSVKKATEGNRYKVKVFNENYPTITAETHIPAKVEFEVVDTIIETQNYEGINYYSSKYLFSIKDPAEISNYYLIEKSVVNYMEKASLSFNYEDKYLQPNPIFDNYKELITDNYDCMYAFFSDSYFNGTPFVFEYKNNENNYQKTDSTQYALYSISSDYYMYCHSKYKYEMAQYDSNSEPVFVYSNVVNGLGIFMGYSVSYNIYK